MKKYEIRGQDIFIPENGDTSWGGDVTEAFGKIANAINDSQVDGYVGAYDVKPTKTAATEDGNWHTIPGLVFDNTQVASVSATITVVRKGGTDSEFATFDLEANYNETAANWFVSVSYTGESDVEFDVTPEGAFQYSAQSLGSTTFELRYRAEAAAI